MASGNIKNFELKVGKAGLIIIVIGMAALLCTAFLLGVDVGKNIDIYPDKIAAFPQKLLAQVWRPSKIGASQSIPENKSAQNQPQTKTQENIDLTFYNALTSKKGILKEQSVAGKQQVILPPENGEENVTANFNMENQKPPVPLNDKKTNYKVEHKEKSEQKAKEIKPNIVSNKQKFKIQAASLKDKNTANEMSKKIASLGLRPRVIKVDVKGKGILYRVIIPGFEDKVQAQEAAKKISQKTGTNCIIQSINRETKKN
jgi:cell division protein FtsN